MDARAVVVRKGLVGVGRFVVDGTAGLGMILVLVVSTILHAEAVVGLGTAGPVELAFAVRWSIGLYQTKRIPDSVEVRT